MRKMITLSCVSTLLCTLSLYTFAASLHNQATQIFNINPSKPIYWQSAGSATLSKSANGQNHYILNLQHINNPMLMWTPSALPSVEKITIPEFLMLFDGATITKQSQPSTIAFLASYKQNPNSPNILQAWLSDPIYNAAKHTLQYHLNTLSQQQLPTHIYNISLSFDGFFNPCVGFYLEHYRSAHLLQSYQAPMDRLHESILEDQNAIKNYQKPSDNKANKTKENTISDIQTNLKNNCKELHQYVNLADPIFSYLLKKAGNGSSCNSYLSHKYCEYRVKYQDTVTLCDIKHAKGLPNCK